MRKLLAATLLSASIAVGIVLSPAQAQEKVTEGVVRIGLLLDMSGPYADINGPGSVVAAKMAVEDFGGKVLGAPIDVVFADHQNKPDIASSIAQRWLENEKVDAITDVAATATALAVINVAKASNKIVLIAAAAGGSSRLTNEACTNISAHWTFNTYTAANVTGKAITRLGGKTWFFITADYAYGYALEKDTSDVVRAAGSEVIGSVRHPLNTADFSSFMLQARSSGAAVIGLANAGADTINAIKSAAEFGITKSGKRSIAALLLHISDVHSLELEAAQGMLLADAFYWDHDEKTRAWSTRFFERRKRMPTSAQAGEYSAVLHYLKSVAAAGTTATGPVMTKMRELPIDDIFARNGRLRADGAMVHDMYLIRVKTPAESRYPWDYYDIKAVVPAEQAFQPLSTSACPLLKD